MNSASARQSISQILGSDSQYRWPLLIAAGAFGGFALLRRTPLSTAIAGLGLWGVAAAARNSTSRAYEASASFALNCTSEKAYSVWRNFEHLSQFLRHVHSVRILDESRSEWTIAGPFERKFSWTAEIVDDRPGERIAWQSVPGSAVETRGIIEFRPRTTGRGIMVAASISYTPPAGSIVKGLFTMLGRNPQFTLREDLRRFKALVEAGEVPTVAGQTHGPRGLQGKVYRQVLREPQNQTEPQLAIAEQRIA